MSTRVPSSARRPVPARVQVLVLAALALFVLVVPLLANRPIDWGADRVVARCEGGIYVVLRGLPVLHVKGTPWRTPGASTSPFPSATARNCAVSPRAQV